MNTVNRNYLKIEFGCSVFSDDRRDGLSDSLAAIFPVRLVLIIMRHFTEKHQKWAENEKNSTK